jgi:hypothetical protein
MEIFMKQVKKTLNHFIIKKIKFACFAWSLSGYFKGKVAYAATLLY